MPARAYFNFVRTGAAGQFYASAPGQTGSEASQPSPGAHYVTGRPSKQSPDYEFYAHSGQQMPDLAEEGDRLLQYDTERIFVFYLNSWHRKPDRIEQLERKLEDVYAELAKQTPAAVAILESF